MPPKTAQIAPCPAAGRLAQKTPAAGRLAQKTAAKRRARPTAQTQRAPLRAAITAPLRAAITLLLLASVTLPLLTAPAFAAADPPIAQAESDAAYAREPCSAYGIGYFTIPGTNTCLRFSGYVRSDVKGGDNPYARQKKDLRRDTYAWRSRASLRVHTASETDLGTLRSFAEFRTQWSAGAEYGDANNEQHVRFAYFEIGGLRIGADDSIFTHWVGYRGNVINDDILTPMQNARTNAISYTFGGAGPLSAVLGVEQGGNEGDTSGFRYQPGGAKRNYKLSQRTLNYAPNVLGGIKWEAKAATLAAVAAYDTYYSEWAAEARLDIRATRRFSLWAMAGYKSAHDYYALDDSSVRYKSASNGGMRKQQGIYRQIASIYGDWGGHWLFIGGGAYALSPQTSVNVQLGYSSDKSFASTANLQHMLAPGLSLTPELTYSAWNSGSGHRYSESYEEKAALKGSSAMQGMLRLQRSF